MILANKIDVLFLDIDGVLNCLDVHGTGATKERFNGYIGIDPAKAALLKDIVAKTGVKVVLSSTWRRNEDSRAEVRRNIGTFYDYTPITNGKIRGREIQMWIDMQQSKVWKYVILDDDPTAFWGHPPETHFKTDFYGQGLTQEIAQNIISYLNKHEELAAEATPSAVDPLPLETSGAESGPERGQSGSLED